MDHKTLLAKAVWCAPAQAASATPDAQRADAMKRPTNILKNEHEYPFSN